MPERSSADLALAQLEVGRRVTVSKTVGETDIYLFAGITGDFSGNHVNEEFMKESIYRHRIAHGVLLIGYMSTCSTRMIERSMAKGIDSTPVSLGYDRVRFLAPVYIGDTVEVVYTIVGADESDPVRGRISSSSPVGRALVGRDAGDYVVVSTPAGEARYRILDIA